MTRLKGASVGLAALLRSACSLFPYDNHFLCEKNADYGRCTNVQGAYRDAVAGSAAAPESRGGTTPRGKGGHAAQEDYQESQYRAMAGLMDAPVAPVLAPAKVLRTLIVAYEDGHSLFMPRYVFYVVGEPHFVMGDYLSQPPAGSPTIYPNGRTRDALEKR